MHDELNGWPTPHGNGAYPNDGRELAGIPDSADFTFRDTFADGLVIRSPPNQLELVIQPIDHTLTTAKGLSRFSLGTASATLVWNGRRLEGRVIREYLFLPAFNRLTRKYAGVFDNFHGVYALAGDAGDFYFHDQQGDLLGELTGNRLGFIVKDGSLSPLEDSEIAVPRATQAFGFYRWPLAWAGTFTAGDQRYQFELALEQKHNIANWALGGFAMGVVTGQLTTDGATLPVYGLGELII
ncbi:MAG: hypothetical protein FD165_2739 [Gammaproteobacteria bacterium]|nr:MAG: hypothetical protein FD165_2739 [Gammaproteobacteria bacterium]TND01423.1 MAG: hypothetical protein FD120_2596 [Gammaproteobacteria bacterium]